MDTHEDEQRVARLLRRANATERAPDALRQRIEAARRPPVRKARSGLGVRYGALAAGAIAVLAAALVLLIPSGTPVAPSVAQAAELAIRGPVLVAPAPDPSAPSTRLTAKVGSLYFPNWASDTGWRAVGARTDRVGDRTVKTVYYQRGGHRVAYSIISAPPLLWPAGWHHSEAYMAFRWRGRTIVTWREAGHTCVLTATGVSAAEMKALAHVA